MGEARVTGVQVPTHVTVMRALSSATIERMGKVETATVDAADAVQTPLYATGEAPAMETVAPDATIGQHVSEGFVAPPV
jgi:hypothetical protein